MRSNPVVATQKASNGVAKLVVAMIENDIRKIDFRIFKDVKSHEATYSAGSEILKPGDTSRMMYIVKSGMVAVQIGNLTVEQVPEGNIFGEMGIVDPQPHTARVVAMTNVHLFGVTEQQFLQLVRTNPSFALRVMRVMARRTRAMNAKLMEAVG
jgi:CRP/FNR family cyclic AMP-dependent transcriptional regulator